MRQFTRSAVVATALLAGMATVPAAANLVLNGEFESTTNGTNAMIGGYYGVSNVTSWTAGGINGVYAPGAADTVGARASAPGNIYIWGPGKGVQNGLTAASPTGGNFIASDGDATYAGVLTQQINGLQIGKVYTLSFYWAAAQWRNEDGGAWNGASTESWKVSLGGETHTTNVLSIVSHGFSGWQSASFNYTATAISEALQFVVVGTPVGAPPIALLDGVSLDLQGAAAVPEPASWAMMLAGFAGLGGVMRARRTRRVRDVTA